MKRSTLYGRAERAFRAELTRTERQIEKFDRSSGARIIGPEKAARDSRRVKLFEKKEWLEREIKKTRRMKHDAACAERSAEMYAMPEGYMRPSEVTNQ